MEYSTGKIGRVVWVRFDDGEDLRAGIEDVVTTEDISCATVFVLGALKEARLVAGPKKAVIPPEPVWESFDDGREIIAVGTIAPGPDGPALHLHTGVGRSGEPTLVGCLREDSKVYLVVEAVIIEMDGLNASRKLHAASGLQLLSFK